DLLRETLYLSLLQENYPDMEDDEIDEFISTTSATNEVWRLATSGATDNASGVLAMKVELRQRLKQRDWLKEVVESAISKRSDLFKRASSPVARLRDTEAAFEKLVNNNLGSSTLSNAVRSDNMSLWRAFVAHANGQFTNALGRG